LLIIPRNHLDILHLATYCIKTSPLTITYIVSAIVE